MKTINGFAWNTIYFVDGLDKTKHTFKKKTKSKNKNRIRCSFRIQRYCILIQYRHRLYWPQQRQPIRNRH